MTIEEAYRAIPHGKTDFMIQNSKLDLESKIYLKQMFDLVNMAIVQRVQTLRWFTSHGKKGNNYQEYAANTATIQRKLNELKAPPSLMNAKLLVAQSLDDQLSYFRKWEPHVTKGKLYQFNSRDPLIQSSHRNLINAYNQLMGTFPLESKVNKQAFFNHLCALDFI
jgi:hypothetical protein